MRARLPDRADFIERGGVKIHYEVYGTGSETLLFLPAWSISYSRLWKSQLPYFSRYYRCIAFDPRGNGKSDYPDTVDAYGVDHCIADALAILDVIKVDKAAVIGLSIGGLYAAILAAYYPERVSAAVALAGAFKVGPEYDFRKKDFNNRIENPQDWQKFNRYYWRQNCKDFLEFFASELFPEPYSTKPFEDAVGWGLESTPAAMEKDMLARMTIPSCYDLGPAMFEHIQCPLLLIHGEQDHFFPVSKSQHVAELTSAELALLPDTGHVPIARFPAKTNILIKDFLDRHISSAPEKPIPKARSSKNKRALYLSSPIGLGHVRRDLAIARELRQLHPDLHINWLTQDPATRLLSIHQESIHPASDLLVNESLHIESEAGEHDLHAFQALRRMDEILVSNFMILQEVIEQGHYDLVIADEAWDIDHFWHEHPEFKKAQLAWLTDFVGFLPMLEGGDHEAYLTTDYNAEMIAHIERSPTLRDRAIFVGNPDDIIPAGFGPDLPEIRDWTQSHFDFCGYVIGNHPNSFGSREELRQRFGYQDGEQICVVTVGGSGVGGHLIRRILDAYPTAKNRIPELRMIVVTGPRIDVKTFKTPQGVVIKSFVPNLDQHLAACDLALVQGGLTTCMELVAAKTPFIYFPLHNHFEQNFHVHHRLQQYRAGRRMDYASAMPDDIAAAMVDILNEPLEYRDVEANGAQRAARMLAELL